MTPEHGWSAGGAGSPPADHVRRSELDNGLRVLTDSTPQRSTVSVSAWVGVGSRDEPDVLAGASHFLEHLLFKGTDDRSARDIAVAVDGVGGDMNAFTSNEHTAFYAAVPAADTALAVDLLLDVISRPALRAHDVDAEREVILEELAAACEDPDDTASVALYEALFPGHPLGRETLGTPETIERLGRDDVVGFFNRWYRPANLVIAAAGALDHDDLLDEVAKRFGDMPGGECPQREAPAADPLPHVFNEHPGELVHVGLGWRAPAITDPDRYALSVLNHAFGGGPSSVLFQEVREARGLTYSIGSDLAQHGDSGALSVHCATRTEHGGQLVELIGHLAEQMAADGIDDDTLARVKGAVRGGVVMAMESVTARMTRLGAGETVLGEVTPLGEYLARIDEVTCDDVRRVAAGVFGSSRSTSVVGPRDVV